MSADSKPLTTAEVLAWFDPCCRCDHSRLLATTRALETAQTAMTIATSRASDEAARAEKAEKELFNVHDALHRECDGTANLPDEIRAIRSEIDEARALVAELVKALETIVVGLDGEDEDFGASIHGIASAALAKAKGGT